MAMPAVPPTGRMRETQGAGTSRGAVCLPCPLVFPDYRIAVLDVGVHVAVRFAATGKLHHNPGGVDILLGNKTPAPVGCAVRAVDKRAGTVNGKPAFFHGKR